jgi:anti-sigma regulatory factor (Ser/Thr protein kinase)
MAENYIREMVVPNDTKYLSNVREMVTNVLASSTIEGKARNMIVLAVDEAIANIMEHATDNKLDSDIKIELCIKSDNEKFQIIIRDSGKRFDPTGIDEVDVKMHLKSNKKHGLGIFLIRQIMDEVNYTYKKDCVNELSMIKYNNN